MQNIQQFRLYDKQSKKVFGHWFFNHDLNIQRQNYVDDIQVPIEELKDRVVVFPYTDYRFHDFAID